MNILAKVKKNPKWHYAFSISATWAGAGSLIVGIQVVKDYGVIPFLLWFLGNVLSCVVFGCLANKFIYIRKVFTSNFMKKIIGIMCIFQIWVNMGGVHDSLMIINSLFATCITYAVCIFFLLFYLKDAVIRNVFTDDWSWRLVYLFIIILCAYSLIVNGTISPCLYTVPGLKYGASKFFTYSEAVLFTKL